MIIAIRKRSGESLGRILLLAAGSLAFATVAGPCARAVAGIDKHVTRTTIAGIDVIAYRTDIKDVVTVLGSLPAGDAMAADNIALATLTGIMLDKGTMTMDKFAIAKRLDQVGAQLGFHVGEQTLTVQARSLKADLPLVLKIMADELRHPIFSTGEFAKAKLEFAGQIQQQAESTEFRAGEAFSRAVFPTGHPNRQSSLEEWRSAIDAADISQVKEFHGNFYGPAHMVLVFVGDLDIPTIQGQIKRDFGGWSGGGSYRSAPTAAVGAAVDQTVSLAGKSSVTLLAGQATGLRYRDANSLPLRIGVAILGSGFTSRLVSTVRDKEGLTYHIGAGVADDTFDDGDWRINASFAPALLDRGIAETQREVLQWWQGGVTAAELQAHKTDMIGSFQVSLATTGGVAGTLLRTVQRGLPLTWIDDYPQSVDQVTLEQVNGAIKRYVDPRKLVMVKAGTIQGGAEPGP